MIVLCFVACCCVQLAGAKRHAFNPGEKRVNPEGLKDLVVDLPGQPQVGFQHYAGYVTVNEEHGRELFYWFFKAASGAKGEKPLVLWLNGDISMLKGTGLKWNQLGNPETSDAEDWQGMVDYAWSHAVVSDETYSIIKETCDFNSSKTWSNEECNKSVQEVLQQYKEIDIYSLYTSLCINNSSNSGVYTTGPVYKKEFTMMPRMMGGNYDPCVDDYAHAFYNRPEVQKALHASDGVNLKDWSICNGDTDGRVPVLSTRYSIDSLGLPKIGSWRPWYHQMQVGGWLQEYEGLTFVTFRGAGHAVPMFKPSNSLALFTSFITGQSLPLQRSNS
ncbi:Serine carboxypeptidase-like 31 [Nymphaea thermarum]|nr:Serine carboxypeptidase-like 31 [Nymphaea thermarum]